jgi:hypothetical protein
MAAVALTTMRLVCERETVDVDARCHRQPGYLVDNLNDAARQGLDQRDAIIGIDVTNRRPSN